MTKIGDSILEEFCTELNESIEDDKNRLLLNQSAEGASSILKLCVRAISIFSQSVLTVCVLLLLTINSETLDLLRSASNEQLISSIKHLLAIVAIFSIFITTLVMAFSQKYFRDKKLERVESDQEELNLVRRIVEVNEEVLRRHGLIKEEGRSND